MLQILWKNFLILNYNDGRWRCNPREIEKKEKKTILAKVKYGNSD